MTSELARLEARYDRLKFIATIGIVGCLLLGLGTAAVGVSRTNDQRELAVEACDAANQLTGYLRHRATTLKGSQEQDVKVLFGARQIVDCRNDREPLDPPEQERYVRMMFGRDNVLGDECKPIIRDGDVADCQPF